jgi:hypothetical protein
VNETHEANEPARMTFPDNWPEGCPPDDAEDANGEV